MDEPEKVRGREDAASGHEAGGAEEAGDGFQLVIHGKKKKRAASGQDCRTAGSGFGAGAGPVRALTREKGDAPAPGAKAKVPCHDPSIPRPQDVYKIRVDNYKPFEHVWLERNEDGTRHVHPLENLPVEQFVVRNVPDREPVKPADLEDTPFTLVQDHKGLTELAKKLKSVTEFAVDLEHNQYRSFQGLTCLMQISTRTEDFIVDTLKLRIYIGLYLQEPFKDPTKRKVMHGADRDIMWLQRDFHIYVCNLFDTGQASRVLQMERNNLEHLLLHFCGVTAKKEYQNADWRSRPLPDEMIKYAREDIVRIRGGRQLLY
uniref:3'-5' exonuclease domain-containing protein n=1 Tax=Zea mays TaxID=4577 RepID=A0A804N7Y0_MAIZE